MLINFINLTVIILIIVSLLNIGSNKMVSNLYICNLLSIFIIFLIMIIFIVTESNIYCITLNSTIYQNIIYRLTFLWTTNNNIYFLWAWLIILFSILIQKKNTFLPFIKNYIEKFLILIPVFWYFIYNEKNHIIENTFYSYDGFHINPN